MNSKKTDCLPRTKILQVNPSYNYCKSRLPQKLVPLFKQRKKYYAPNCQVCEALQINN